MLDHRLHRIVKLIIVYIEEHQLRPQMRRLARPDDLGDVDARPEELQVLHHLLWLVLGVQDGQFREHAHVRTLQAQTGLQ